MFDNVYFKDRAILFISIPSAVFGHACRLSAYLKKIIATTPKWYKAPLVYLNLLKKTDIDLRNGDRFILTKDTLHKLIGIAESNVIDRGQYKGLNLKDKGDTAIFTMFKKRVRVDRSSIGATLNEFSSESHRPVDVRNRVVLDVGAYMGETALLYAIWGKAKHVYTFEPVDSLYRTTRRNVQLNKLDNRITPIMALLVGNKERYCSSNSFELHESNSRMIVLDNFVKRIDLKKGVLKLDCEGGEYEIIKDASNDTLRRFKELHIEYHYGYRDIVERLRVEGFDVKYTKPRLSIVGKFSGIKYMGEIIARR